MVILKQSTQVVISFGPFVLNSDGVTYVTGLAGTGANQTENTSTGIRVSKNGGALAARAATAVASTYDAFGMYLATLKTGDVDTVGVLRVTFGNAAAFVPVWQDFLVVPANVYDSLVGGTDVLDVSLIQWLGVAPNALQSGQVQALTNLIRAGTAQAGGASSITLDAGASAVTDFHKGNMLTILSGTGSGQTRIVTAYNGATKVATIGAAWATNPDNTSVFAVLGLRSALLGTDGEVLISADVQDLSGTLSVNAKKLNASTPNNVAATDIVSAGAITTSGGAVSTVTALSAAGVQAIWDALTSALTTVGSIGKWIVDKLDVVVSTRTKPADTQARVTLVDTTTTNTDMRGTDSAALAATALSTATWTSARAGYLDNLNGLRVKKNTALAAFPFLMVLSSDHITVGTGLTVTATRSINGAAFGACANAVVEVGSGVYVIDLAAADLNGNTITLKLTATGADQRTIVIVTEP